MMVHVRTSPEVEMGGEKKIQKNSFGKIDLPISRKWVCVKRDIFFFTKTIIKRIPFLHQSKRRTKKKIYYLKVFSRQVFKLVVGGDVDDEENNNNR